MKKRKILRFLKKKTKIILFTLLSLSLMANLLMGFFMFQANGGMNNEAKKAQIIEEFQKEIAKIATIKDNPFYASELKVNMIEPSSINQAIQSLASMAPLQGKTPLKLNEEELKRYIAMGTEPYITCEFCCGAKTLVNKDGTPTCACAHSMAMRGTLGYLIKNYPQMENKDMMYEIVRQKGFFFPKQMQKRLVQQLVSEEEDYTNDTRYLVQNMTKKGLKNLREKALKAGLQNLANNENMVGEC